MGATEIEAPPETLGSDKVVKEPTLEALLPAPIELEV